MAFRKSVLALLLALISQSAMARNLWHCDTWSKMKKQYFDVPGWKVRELSETGLSRAVAYVNDPTVTKTAAKGYLAKMVTFYGDRADMPEYFRENPEAYLILVDSSDHCVSELGGDGQQIFDILSGSAEELSKSIKP